MKRIARLPKSIIRKYGISKKAWRIFKRGKKGKSKGKSKRKGGSKTTTRRGGFTIPLAVVGGLAGSPAIQGAIAGAMQGNMEGALKNLRKLAGISWSGHFDIRVLGESVGPIIAGLLIHKFVGGRPLNLNQSLARSGIPFIRI